MINGLFVPGTPINRRIAIEGQSNGVGQAAMSELSAAPLASDAGLAAYGAGTFSRVFIFNSATGTYDALKLGTNNIGGGATLFGPEFGLAVRWMRETLVGNLYIDKFCANGQPISYFQSGNASGFFNTATSNRTNADFWLSTNKVKVVDMGWLWAQGEADQTQTAAYYQGALDTYITGRIGNGSLSAIGQRVIAKMYPGTGYYSATVDAGKDAYAAANPTAAKIITFANYFNTDNVHLNARGQLQLGYDAFEKFFGAVHLVA